MIYALTEGARALLLVAASVILGAVVLAWRAIQTPVSSPARLIAELRLAQLAGAILVFTAGASLGLAATHADQPGAALDVMIALGFLVAVAVIVLRDPREALPLLALAFAVHALIDVLHRPGMLTDNLAPRWFVTGCALHDVALGIVCYLPVLRRK